jgi:RND family efflux transporter MFP subunit
MDLRESPCARPQTKRQRPARTAPSREARSALFFITAAICYSSVLGLFGCGQKPAAQVPPPPTVTVAKPVKKEIIEWQYFTARTQAMDTVSITPRVTGYIDNITFKEGDIVNFGDLLFLIDPRPYQAALDQAKGQFEQALAQQKLNNANLARAKDLLSKNVIAIQDYETTAAQKSVADAQVIASQAAVESAQLNLDFTHIRAPIRGRIGAQLVDRGNLVTANSTQLTTLVSIDPMYANFFIDEGTFMRYQEAARLRNLAPELTGPQPVWLRLQTEQGFPHAGVIDFVNNTFDPSTSTLQVRGRFPNPDGFLVPGAFGTVRIAGSPRFEAILVADRAIGSDQDQKYVVVVQPDGLTKFQRVELGPIVDGLRVVRSGLNGDEMLVVDGVGKVRPNSKVNAEPTDMNKYATEQLALETQIGPKADSSAARQTKISGNRSPAPTTAEVGGIDSSVSSLSASRVIKPETVH